MYDNKWTYKDRDNGYLYVMVHLRDDKARDYMLFMQASGIKGSVGEEFHRSWAKNTKEWLQICIIVSAAETVLGTNDDYVMSTGAG